MLLKLYSCGGERSVDTLRVLPAYGDMRPNTHHSWFPEAPGVHGPFGAAPGADHGVELVDEGDDLSAVSLFNPSKLTSSPG